METDLDAFRADCKDVTDDVSDHETRLHTLERTRWPLPSLAALTGVAAPLLTLYGLLTK
ncbi:hypothetical protein GCM10012280_24950 [Wenjunlia tyrosinilytica]|uniref:Uncharacterized protein n=1 Tax=Wenjunlia tyrosinilytica TaxID=1544741 RepID=A0A918DXV2_9ACTN|nr:hypothetical protein GCM10012280_24950 [Wenjunlia tyrosinilytica]